MDQARELIETGPRGPLFTLSTIEPGRTLFHTSEAIAHAAMVGHYMLATGRVEAAELQLEMLADLAPEHALTRHLDACLEYRALSTLLGAIKTRGPALGNRAPNRFKTRRKGR